MNLPVVCITELLFLIFFCPVSCGKKAQIILEFKTESGTYEWNRNVLADISKLQSPFRLIFILGVEGGRTLATLDLTIHIWSGTRRNYVEEIFQQTDHRNSVVWAYIFQLPGTRQEDEVENVLLLYVSHMDFDDASFKSSYGRFFAIISSGFSVFVQEMFQNSSLLSLSPRGSSLGNLIFNNIGHNDLPKPHVVVNGPFESDSEVCQVYTVEPSFEKSIQEARELLKDYEKLRKSEHWNATKRLVATYREMPIIKTPKGSRIDGAAIVELAAGVKIPMDADSWSDIVSIYETLDRNICKRSHKELIQALITSKASETEAKAMNFEDEFAKKCALRNENANFRQDLQRTVRAKNQLVNIERNLEEEKRRGVEAEKRKMDRARKIQETRTEMEKEHTKLWKFREEARVEIEFQTGRYKKTRKEIRFLEKDLSKKEGGWLDVIGPAIFRQRPVDDNFSNRPENGGGKGKYHDPNDSWFNAIIQTLTVFNGLVSNALQIRDIIVNSDERLKQNIITLPRSEYSIIGIRVVCWEWNAIAEKTFGFKGNACGVIAQEVQKLYPSVVTEGNDGYLRVQFDALQDKINEALTYNKNASYPMCLTGHR